MCLGFSVNLFSNCVNVFILSQCVYIVSMCLKLTQCQNLCSKQHGPDDTDVTRFEI